MNLENTQTSKYNLTAQMFWWLTLFGGFLVCGASLYGISSLSVEQCGILFIALIISLLAAQHQVTIPQTKIKITVKEFIVFWGVLWFGLAGGVLLAAAVFAVQHFSLPENRQPDGRKQIFSAFTDLLAIGIAGKIFALVWKSLSGLDETVAVTHPIDYGWLVISAAVMVFLHYLVFSLLTKTFSNLVKRSLLVELRKETLNQSLGKYIFGTTAALILYFAFLQFGFYFSLVIFLLTVFAHFAHRLHVRRFEEKTREISEASRIHLATVEALATAIDARDQVGMGHVRRTQIYAVGIGEQMQLSDSELEALNTGALLHDIGKLAVPDHILNKPGRLTRAEFEKMKIHAPVGAAILEKIPFNYPVLPTVKHHHEMWDGSGYPEGLKGESIPLTARVLAVADVYDSMRGAHSYRPALSRDEARRFLINGAGTQFDPNIVDVFLRNLGKFEAEVEAQGFSYKFDKERADNTRSISEDEADLSYIDQIKRANREVFTLYELARVFSSSLNLPETLSLFAKKIGELVPFDTCAVYLMDETEIYAKAAYVQGKNKGAMQNKRIKTGEGATGFVLKQRKTMQNIEPGLDFTYSEFELSDDYTAMTAIPLIADEKLLGAVSLYSCGLESYEEEHIRLLETISRIASDAIGKSIQHAESESLALTDTMTGLPNARSLQMQFEKEAARVRRNGTNFHLLMLDLDGFKAVNDTFGHKAGDKLLKELAGVMNAQLRDYDFLARYAGDEFVVIVSETEPEEIQELSRRIEEAIDNFVLPLDEGQSARVGVSIGIGCYPNHGVTLDQIIIHADKAMYAVKATRKRSRDTQNLPPLAEIIPAENYIVELDESHIVSSAIN